MLPDNGFRNFFHIGYGDLHSLIRIKKGELVWIDARAFFGRCAKELPAQIRNLLRKLCNGRILFLDGSRQGGNGCIQLGNHILQLCKLDVFCVPRHWLFPRNLMV